MSTQPQSEPQNNHKEKCRICLKGENLKPLYEKYENEHITEMLQTCFSIQVREDDDLPKKICLTCVSELAQAYKLSKKFQTTKTILNDQKPKPIALIKTIDPDTNDDEFVLPDKSIDRKDIEIGGKNEFILIDRNIIRKIKDHKGQQEIPSPSEELKMAKLKIINAKSNVVEEIISTPVKYKTSGILKQTLLNTVTPERKVQMDERNVTRTPGKINILSIKPINKDLSSIRDKNKNITNLQLDSVIKNKNVNENEIKKKINETENENEIKKSKTENKNDIKKKINETENKSEIKKKINESENKNEKDIKKKINEIEINSEKENTNNSTDVKLKETNSERLNNNHKWNTRSKIYKTRRNNKLKKKSRKDFSYSSARYHEQFEKFLTGAKITNDKGEIPEGEENTHREKMEKEEYADEEKMEKEEYADGEKMEREEIFEAQQSTSSISNNNNLIEIVRPKEKLGYKLRFANKKVECPICKKNFKYLESHIRIHSNKKLASKKLLANIKLANKNKIEIEKVEKQLFGCKYCDRKFSQKNMLLNHERIHQEVKQFPCSLCEKSFNKLRSLQQHFNMHTKKNLYQCDICNNRSYNIKSNLYRHQRVCALKSNGKRYHRKV